MSSTIPAVIHASSTTSGRDIVTVTFLVGTIPVSPTVTRLQNGGQIPESAERAIRAFLSDRTIDADHSAVEPRCEAATPDGYRCDYSAGHDGMWHRHVPCDPRPYQPRMYEWPNRTVNL